MAIFGEKLSLFAQFVKIVKVLGEDTIIATRDEIDEFITVVKRLSKPKVFDNSNFGSMVITIFDFESCFG